MGRTSETAELQQFLSQARRGHGSLIMIGGEPGIGKTRLVEELSAESRHLGLLSLTGHCYEMKGTAPYIAFVEILEATARLVKPDVLLEILGDSAPEVARLMPELRRMFPDLPPPTELPPEQERRYLFNSFLEFIERAGHIQPILLILEDLHWADESTLLLLEHIAQQLHAMPVLIVGTYRDTELKTAVSLARAMEELLRQRLAHDILLKRLSETHVSAMLGARSGKEVPRAVLQLIFRETEGNPFFVEEVFKHLAEEGKLFEANGQWRTDVEIGQTEVPRSVLLVIERRLERISDQCRRIMTAAAFIGRGFGFDLLQEIVDADEETLLEAIDEAERVHIITSTTKAGAAQLMFAHELTRQTLLSGLSLPRRQRLHLRIALAMEKLYAEALTEHASDLAYHLHQAGATADPEKATRHITLAGDKALDAAAFEEALRLYEQAISLQPSHDQFTRADLLDRRGQALRSLGRRDDALDDWRKALALYEQTGNNEAVASMCAKISEHLFTDGIVMEAYDVSKRGLEAIGESTSYSCSMLLAIGALQISYLPEADFQVVNEMFNQSVKIAKELENELLLGHVLENKGCYCRGTWQGQDAARIGLEAAKLLQSNGNYFDAATALGYHHYGLMISGHLPEAERVGPDVESLSVRVGHDISRFLFNSQDLGREVMVSVNLEDVEKRFVDHLALGEVAGVAWVPMDYPRLGYIQLWRGRWEDARESFQQGSDLEFPGVMAGYCVGPLFLFLAYEGDKDDALAVFADNKDKLPRSGQTNAVGAWSMLCSAIEGLAMLGEHDEAAKLYPLAREAIKTGNTVRPLFSGLVHTTAGIAAAASGEWEQAEEHYQTALREAHEIPHRIEQPEVRRWYARMLIER
ncbi:MAG: ATP-binding protein, partial [Planctomycetota bacterium]